MPFGPMCSKGIFLPFKHADMPQDSYNKNQCAQRAEKHPLSTLTLYYQILVFLLFLEVCLQELLLYITRYRLVVSEVHCECGAT